MVRQRPEEIEDETGKLIGLDQTIRDLNARVAAIEKRLSIDSDLEVSPLSETSLTKAEWRRELDVILSSVERAYERISGLSSDIVKERQEIAAVRSEGLELRKEFDAVVEMLDSQGDRIDSIDARLEDISRGINEGGHPQIQKERTRLKRSLDYTGIVIAAAFFFISALLFRSDLDALRNPYFTLFVGLVLVIVIVLRQFVTFDDLSRLKTILSGKLKQILWRG